ncbi:hypothetical protein D884_03187 [Pseudomonas sp. URMO17WK12:I10]|uniref:hypothetical protein n=1 Tax=unclassified Pseudomonas TaxID=196821 RepID=UPI00048914F8|nr:MULTISPECIES: hypothetical protein [unclassified Pseudomonas]RDL17062.1 hypothetical protein F633_03475 [Pseudomonas sp. LAMO17WK12:I3]RED05076.1 hypothetical protein D884_03187 [Pseudomonas sp. URMO17WK12:I10]SOD08457.1 hypothetical protein SAMN05660967_01671 [Pseudomonas sp. URMO17WK12:I9]
MSIDKEALKALSEAANAVTTDVNITMAVGSAPEEVKAVQDFLQHAMPKTILALVAEIERLEKFEEWFVRLDQAEQSLSASFKAERDQLKAENEALANLLKRFVDGEHDQDEDLNERHEYHGEAQSMLMRMGGEFREYSLVPNDALFAQHQQLSALRKAADRYTWLRNKQTFIWLIQDWFPGAEFTDVDAEIDAVMARERAQ